MLYLKRITGILLVATSMVQLQAQTVNVLQLVEHPALNEAYRGTVDGLDKQGFNAASGLKIVLQNAQGNPATATQIAKKFAGEAPDAIVAIATPAAQAMAANTTSLPIIFTAVSDPVGAKLVENLQQPEANITGVIDLAPLAAQFDLMQSLIPQMKRIGIIYNPGEANSVTTVKQFKAEAEKRGLQVVESAVTKTAEVGMATRRFIDKVDLVYVPLDNTAISAFESIVIVGNEAKLPIVTADTNTVERGAIAAVGFNFYQIGLKTGELTAKVLKGEKIANLPVAVPDEVELYINLKAAKAQGVEIPETVREKAQKVFE